ncbi:hypothetical protein DYB32_005902 [Aphanomyces invadans]|uniref:MSP domain-containing protein n=1 Tax=Aphanomyces invadans TaxID=157072 RepID=A0A418AT70_9STRA|nr:hypothetical protein DYB32_005902 [Aphanomyces invadans]
MFSRESMAVGGGGASSAVRLPRRSAGEVAFDVDAPSNSSLAFEPAEVMTFTLVHPTPSKTFQLLSVVNLHPSHTTFFSVKTLKPERYFIKPSKCMLGPREQIVVRIELRQALYDEVIVHFSHEHKLVTDRLLIQSGCNTNPIHDSAFQAALQFKNEPKSKEKDAAWSAAWKTLTSSQIHAKNLIMRFEASPDFGKVPQTIDTSTPSTTAVALRATIPRQPAVSDPLFTTHESTFSIEEVFHDIPATQQQAPHSQRKLAPPKPTHVPAPRTAPPVDSSASRKSSVGKREKSGLSLALVPSTESLVFSVSPHNTTSYSTLSIENLAPHQRVCFTVRIESKFRCKSLPYRVGLIDGAGTASVQLELAMSLHNEIVQQLAQAVDIEPFKVRLQVMEMDDVTAAAATALPTDEARAQFLKALWQSPPKRMFVQKYVAAFVLDKTPPAATTVAAVVPTPAPAIVGPGGGGGDDDDKFGDAERLSVVSECASYATAFTRAPPMRPIMTPLEHLQYQRSLNRHLLNQNGTNDNAGPLRATILELTEADELFAAQENARQAKKDQVQPEPEPTIDSLIDPEILRQVVPSQPSVENIALQDKMQARPFAACPSKDMENSMPIVPTVASAEPDPSVDITPPVVDAALAAVGLDPSIKSQEGGFHVPSSVPPETPAATIDVDDDDSSQEQDESEESSGSEDSHEEIDAHDGRAASFPSDADSESSDGMDKFDEEGDDLVSELQPRRESHDDWSVFNPRPSTIDDDASGFSILTYSDSQSDQPRSPETAPTPAMDWVYDEQQQAFVETSAVHSAQDIPSPPTSPRSSSNLSPSAHHDRPPPLSTNGASPVASPTSSPARLSSHKSKSRFSLLKAFERNHGPSKPVGLVTLTPQTILYHMDVGSKPSGKVTLTNLTSSLVVYKIKSAQPARYKVKPSQGFIEPRGHVVVAVDLQVDAYDELIRLSSMELGDIRDCLLVETVKGPSSRSAKALRNAKTHGELVGILRALWSTVDKKEVNASRLFCEYSFDDSAYQSFTATVDGPTVPLVDEPKTPPATKQAKRFGWKRSKTNKVLRNAL